MNRADLYFKSTAILITAYQKETIFYNGWDTCPVGQLIAGNMGYEVRPHLLSKKVIFANWYKEKTTISSNYGGLLKARTIFHEWFAFFRMGCTKFQLQKKHINCTGYSVKELRSISRAFESSFNKKSQAENILAGLRKAFDELKKIHQVTYGDLLLQYKKQFEYEEEMLTKNLPEKYEWLDESTNPLQFDYDFFMKSVKKRQSSSAQATYVKNKNEIKPVA